MCAAEFKGTVVAVTHDRYFLDNVAGWILELDRGSGIPFEGNYTEWLTAKQKRLQVRFHNTQHATALCSVGLCCLACCLFQEPTLALAVTEQACM